MTKVGIVGGGPGGLLAAYFLEQKFKGSCQITLFEASSRTGGKIRTEYFQKAPVLHEAGVAELYSYKKIGPDPLLELIHNLGLKTIPMHGQTVLLEGKVLRNKNEIRKLCGQSTLTAIEEFRQLASDQVPLNFWYEGFYQDQNDHSWSMISFSDLLDTIGDSTARKYIKVAAHSDLATEPHLTNGLYGVYNALMDVPGYLELYTLEGGIEQFTTALKDSLTHTIFLLESSVVRIERTPKNLYRVSFIQARTHTDQDFDVVFVCLPINWLNSIEWGGEKLRQSMAKHIAYYDKPGHYLRVTLLFQTPFWRWFNQDSWFISDAFGGICVYDESLRYHIQDYGVLSFLMAGSDAVTMANYKDEELVEKTLDSLPDELYSTAKEQFLEGKVDRWLASVSGLPGGFPTRPTRESHLPETEEHPGFFLVGDYLFDTTINGVLDSADFATNLFRTWSLQHCVENQDLVASLSDSPRRLFDHYYSAEYLQNIINVVWRSEPPYRLLEIGSANGLHLKELSQLGVDAWGVESAEDVHHSTPHKLTEHHVLANLHKLPFPDNSFDFVFDTHLCFIPENQIAEVARELYRVTRQGFIFATLSSDVSPDLLKHSGILRDIKTLMTLWEWSEVLITNGFELAELDGPMLHTLKKCMRQYHKKDDEWYIDKDCLSYCFYTKKEESKLS